MLSPRKSQIAGRAMVIHPDKLHVGLCPFQPNAANSSALQKACPPPFSLENNESHPMSGTHIRSFLGRAGGYIYDAHPTPSHPVTQTADPFGASAKRSTAPLQNQKTYGKTLHAPRARNTYTKPWLILNAWQSRLQPCHTRPPSSMFRPYALATHFKAHPNSAAASSGSPPSKQHLEV